jgi:hypothetical protein
MFIANRYNIDPSFVWVKGTTKAELKQLGITIYCIVHSGYDYLYLIKRSDLLKGGII